MFRVLNAEVKCKFRTVPASPEVEIVRLPGHTVAYDANSMAAVEIDDRLAYDLEKGSGEASFPGMLPWPRNFPPLYIPVEANGGDPKLTVQAGDFTASGTLSQLGPCPSTFDIGAPPFGPIHGRRQAPLLSRWNLALFALLLLVVGTWVLHTRPSFRNGLPLL